MMHSLDNFQSHLLHLQNIHLNKVFIFRLLRANELKAEEGPAASLRLLL